MSDASPPTVRERSERVAFRRGISLLALTLLVPGSAQVIAGGRGVGRFALRVWLVVVAALVSFIALALLRRDWASWALYAHPVTQWVASVVVVVLGVGWALLFLDAWRSSCPRGMGRRGWGMAALSGLLPRPRHRLRVDAGLGAVQVLQWC